MKRLLLVVLFALIAFYVAWPGISAWQIYGAVKTKDPTTLSQKVDFPSVREAMRPAVEKKISGKIEEIKTQANGTAAIVAGLVQGGLLEKITTIVLQSIVTPENLIRLAGEPGTLPEKIERIVKQQMGQFGGLKLGRGGDDDTEAHGVAGVLRGLKKFGGIKGVVKTIRRDGDSAAGQSGTSSSTAANGAGQTSGPPKLGLSNIKSFGFAGPLAFDVGLARDPSADVADLTARMEFKEFDWKLTRIVPHLK